MKRRLATLLGLLSLSACVPIDDEPTPVPPSPPLTTGIIKGTLTPFSLSSSAAGTGRPAMLRDPKVRQRLSQSLSAAVASARGSQQAALGAEESDADAIPGEVIVRFEQPLSEEAALARVRMPGYRAVHRGTLTDHLHVIAYESLAPRAMRLGETAALSHQVAALGGVRYAEKNVRVQALRTPNDPFYARQWHYPMMNLPAAWDLMPTGWDTGSGSGAGVNMAVLDTGIVRHPDLDSRVAQGADLISTPSVAGDRDGRDPDPTDMGKDQPDGSSSWHGSHVAGTMGAVSNDGNGVAGVTWSGKLVPVRVLGRGGGSSADIMAGIQWAAGNSVTGLSATNGTSVRVINMSLGGQSAPSAAMQEVIDGAVAKGIVIVVAAGNSNADAASFFPCNQRDVICVGATRFNGRRASYSNYGTPVDVMATGGETSEDLDGDRKPDGVLSTVLDSADRASWEYHQGTSMASPHVAGIVAMMLTVNPTLTPSQVEQILKDTADTASRCSEGCGAGLVNAQAAVLKAKNGLDPRAPPRLGVGATQLSFSGNGTQQISVRNLGGGSLKVTAAASGSGASALSFGGGGSLTLSAYASGALSVSLSGAGLSNGDYSPLITLTGDNGEKSSVQVRFRVGATSDKDAVLAFAYLDAADEWQIDQEGIAFVRSSTGYAYSLSLKPQKYYALGTIDDDGDGEYFEDEDRVGVWRDANNFEAIPVSLGQTVNGINFALVPGQSQEEPDTYGIGGPCTSGTQCDSGMCNTSFPQGYCTQDCLQTGACPEGSSCYYTDASNTAARCYADCTGKGSQGSCRVNYTCVETDLSAGACIPKR